MLITPAALAGDGLTLGFKEPRKNRGAGWGHRLKGLEGAPQKPPEREGFLAQAGIGAGSPAEKAVRHAGRGAGASGVRGALWRVEGLRQGCGCRLRKHL